MPPILKSFSQRTDARVWQKKRKFSGRNGDIEGNRCNKHRPPAGKEEKKNDKANDRIMMPLKTPPMHPVCRSKYENRRLDECKNSFIPGPGNPHMIQSLLPHMYTSTGQDMQALFALSVARTLISPWSYVANIVSRCPRKPLITLPPRLFFGAAITHCSHYAVKLFSVFNTSAPLTLYPKSSIKALPSWLVHTQRL
jgi:hypothetical protein